MSAVFPCFGSDSTHVESVAPRCPNCGAPLVLHQPDAGLPHRLLAVCESCTAWYVSDACGLLLTPIAVEGRRRPARRGADH